MSKAFLHLTSLNDYNHTIDFKLCIVLGHLLVTLYHLYQKVLRPIIQYDVLTWFFMVIPITILHYDISIIVKKSSCIESNVRCSTLIFSFVYTWSGLGSRASAATKPQITTVWMLKFFFENRDCHIWARFRLSAGF